MQHKSGLNRQQLQIISLDQMADKEAMVRIIDTFVEMLDMKRFGFTYYDLNKEGRPPYHPKTMMKLYLYGYQNTIRSCRKLEKACRTNIEAMWLINQQKPHYKTIANFRKDNAKAFKEVFRFFVGLLKEWSLIDGKTIAIDSFKIRAQNSLKINFIARKVKRHIDYIDDKILAYEKQLDQEFDHEIIDKVSYNLSKKANYQKINQQLKSSGGGQISMTGSDAKAVVFQRNSVRVGYNIQAATVSKHKLIIAADTVDVNDTKALAVMLKKFKII